MVVEVQKSDAQALACKTIPNRRLRGKEGIVVPVLQRGWLGEQAKEALRREQNIS
jgi:hypothetical protein